MIYVFLFDNYLCGYTTIVSTVTSQLVFFFGSLWLYRTSTAPPSIGHGILYGPHIPIIHPSKYHEINIFHDFHV